jgi:hypothetical protein
MSPSFLNLLALQVLGSEIDGCQWKIFFDLDESNQRFVYRFLDFHFNLKKVAKGESHQRSL